jgi:hypothetical protein
MGACSEKNVTYNRGSLHSALPASLDFGVRMLVERNLIRQKAAQNHWMARREGTGISTPH